MKVLLIQDVYSNFSKQKQSLTHTSKAKTDGFIRYGAEGSICDVVSKLGEVYIVQLGKERFTVHESKVQCL